MQRAISRPTGLDSDRRSWRRLVAAAVCALAAGALLVGGCARYNTFYNAEKAFQDAERGREEAIKQGQDVGQASNAQRQNYLRAIAKAQKVLDMYPGHSLSDDALFLQGKAHHRMASYRMSIRQLDLLFTNFPRTPYMEEALFLQAVNFLMINDAARSQDLLDLLERQFPDSRFQAEAMRASGDNAFALRDWHSAVAAYRRYLERHPRGEDWDNSSLQLAAALWELERYGEAVPVLEGVVGDSPLPDRVFRARLLLCRCRIRLGELEAAETMVASLKNEAEIHGQQGMVGLVEAEILLARNQRGAAVALLEGMPEDQLTREVKPLWAEILGHAYLAAGDLATEDLEKARDYFQQAVGGGPLLREPERTRLLLGALRDYLAAMNQLPDAPPDRAARLRLLQANALLFSFERPRLAYEIFTALAADTSVDSTVAPRALYGAMLLQGSYFEQPDTAAIYAELLQDRYPDSPQAYRARSGDDFDLYTFLLAQEITALRAAQEELADGPAGLDPAVRPDGRLGSGLRRQMIYLQRRPHLVFPPPPAALQAQAARREREQAAAAAAAADKPSVDTRPARAETLSFDQPQPLAPAQAPPRIVAPDSAAVAAAESLAAVAATAPVDTVPAGDALTAPEAAAEPEPAPEPEPEVAPETKPKPERPRRWDF